MKNIKIKIYYVKNIKTLLKEFNYSASQITFPAFDIIYINFFYNINQFNLI
jgi:hypothetical protein